MATIRQATEADVSVVRDVILGYSREASIIRLQSPATGTIDIAALLEHDMAKLYKSMPPSGQLLLAMDGPTVVALMLICKRSMQGVAEA